MGRGKGRVGLVLVAQFEHEAHVVGRFVPDLAGIRVQGMGGVGDRLDFLVIDQDHFGGVLRLLCGFGDDPAHRIADHLDRALRKRGIGRSEHRRAVGLLARHRAGDITEAGCCIIFAGPHAENARSGLCRGGIDRQNFRIGMRRAEHVAIGLVGPVQVI